MPRTNDVALTHPCPGCRRKIGRIVNGRIACKACGRDIASADGSPAEPVIAIAVYPTRYGTEGVRVTFDWPLGRLENPNALRAQMARTLADIYEAASCMDGCPSLGQPEIDGLNLMGGDYLRAVMRFETDGGTPAEAETLSDIIHDAVPAPL